MSVELLIQLALSVEPSKWYGIGGINDSLI